MLYETVNDGTHWLKHRVFCCYLVIFAAAGADASSSDTSVNVPLSHWGYGFVERFETVGAVDGLGTGIKPFSRREMARALSQIAAHGASDGSLSTVDRERLKLLLGEFRDEVNSGEVVEVVEAGSTFGRIRSGEPLAQYDAEQGRVQADLLLRQQSDLFGGRGRDGNERIFRNRLGGRMRGRIGDWLGFRVSFEQIREQGSRDYILRDDVFESRLELPQLKENLADYHRAKAQVVFALPQVRFEIGKQEVSWGPAAENLGLSNNSPSFDMVRLRSRIGAFKVVSIAGALRPCPDRGDTPQCRGLIDSVESYIVNGVDRRLDRDKYLAAHRIEVALASWLDLGYQEVVVYGDRGLQLAYLNPFMFYQAAQSYLGDKDNLMMGLDLTLRLGKGTRLYLAYVVDDLKKLRVFSEDFVNKFSFQSGLLWVNPMGVGDTDLRAEYVRIEPWVYTHKVPINTFRHFDAPLGHSLGPNSDRWSVQAERRFQYGLTAGVELYRRRHGDNVLLADGTIVNVGGDMHLGRRPEDESETKEFLAGVLGRWTGVSGRLVIRRWVQLQVAVEYGLEWGDNVPLPPSWGPHVPVSNQSGYGDGRQRHMAFDLTYGEF